MREKRFLRSASVITSLVITTVAVGCSSSAEDDDADSDGNKADTGTTALERDSPVQVSGATGESFLFQFTVPANPNFNRLQFLLDNPDGDADLLVRFGQPPEVAEFEDGHVANFVDRDRQTTVGSSHCDVGNVCDEDRSGFVDRMVQANFIDARPGTYFVTVVGGDGYAQNLDKGLANPARPEFRDMFNATLVVKAFSDGVELTGQSVELKIDEPFAYFGRDEGHAFLKLTVPPGHDTLRFTLKSTDPRDQYPGDVFIRRDAPFVESELKGGKFFGLHFDVRSFFDDFPHEDGIPDMPATPGDVFLYLGVPLSGDPVRGTLTATLDPP